MRNIGDDMKDIVNAIEKVWKIERGQKKNGFTSIELLVVIAIIAILAVCCQH